MPATEAAAAAAPAAAAGEQLRVPRCTEEQLVRLIMDHDSFVFDLDGTIWRGNELIDGALEALELLRGLGKRVMFLTNNSMKSRRQYLQKFDALGIRASLGEIYGSAYCAAAYLDAVGFDRSKKVYVVGEQGIMDELEDLGISACGGPQDNGRRVSFSGEVEVDPEVGAVVCGVDPSLSYYKIARASLQLLRDPGCLFVATNADARGHFTPNQEWPGAGATVAAISAVVEREPVVAGKPSPFLVERLASEHCLDPTRSVMVGDRLDTDCAWGLRAGMTTLLVMTGVTDDALLTAQFASGEGGAGGAERGGGGGGCVRPHHVLDGVGHLLRVRHLVQHPSN